MRTLRCLALLLLVGVAGSAHALAAEPPAPEPRWTWYEVDANRNVRINMYLFWSTTCPHCAQALEFTRDLQERRPWVNVYTYEITGNPANRELYSRMAASFKGVAGPTPAFFFCNHMQIGYISYEQTGRRIEEGLILWHTTLRERYKPHRGSARAVLLPLVALVPDEGAAGPEGEPPPLPELPGDLTPPRETVHVPGWGDVEEDTLSLPMLTLVLAGCDAFNPCAFFVLMLLLSLLVHGRSRPRMLLVGGTFVFFSGLVYFLFMAAWLNLFLVLGHLALITAVAGAAAVVAALFNLKDFFWFKQGPSLSIPDSARPRLFQRMAGLINAASLPSLLAGAAVLAFTANLYELLCTSGFPMVYTRVLTLRQLPPATYYLFLLFYNVIYVAPLALIVLLFVLTLGSRKLTENEGRVLKLLSGLMMLALGILLVVRPVLLSTVVGAVATLAAAVALTGLIVVVDRWWRGPMTGAATGVSDFKQASRLSQPARAGADDNPPSPSRKAQALQG
jgi:hypothetical protein